MSFEVELRLDGTTINSLHIVEAVPMRVIHAALGPPDRILEPLLPAPYGHRNNQIHIYDSLGIYFNEHHFTRRAHGVSFVVWPEEEGRFAPSNPFVGRLVFAGFCVPSHAMEREVAEKSDVKWDMSFAGLWLARQDGFSVGFTAKGALLRSGNRSSVRRVVSFHSSWPHDPWEEPAP